MNKNKTIKFLILISLFCFVIFYNNISLANEDNLSIRVEGAPWQLRFYPVAEGINLTLQDLFDYEFFGNDSDEWNNSSKYTVQLIYVDSNGVEYDIGSYGNNLSSSDATSTEFFIYTPSFSAGTSADNAGISGATFRYDASKFDEDFDGGGLAKWCDDMVASGNNNLNLKLKITSEDGNTDGETIYIDSSCFDLGGYTWYDVLFGRQLRGGTPRYDCSTNC